MKTINYKTVVEAGVCLANIVARQLQMSVTQRGMASLAVPGGSTPELFLKYLSDEDIEWSKINVTTTDERMVDRDHPRSNSKLIHETLLSNNAAEASFFPQNGPLSLEELSSQFHRKFIPLDVCVLGMGSDGHTASLFPGVEDVFLDPDCPKLVAAVDAPGGLEPRISLTASALLKARFIHVLIQGKEKWNVYQQALKGSDTKEMPIRLLFNHAGERIVVHHAEHE